MKKFLYCFLFSLLISHYSFSYAKPVSVQTAQRAAETLLGKTVTDVTPVSYTECYLFVGNDGQGFALIAADDCVPPVLGYSLTGTFSTDGQPAHISAWINAYQLDIARAKLEVEEHNSEWDRLLVGRKFCTERDTAVGPLMTTTWNQSPLYNDHCPGASVTGCVATATAQVMKYWNHPVVGRGFHSYTPNGFEIQSARFDTTHYDWAHMPDDLNWFSSDTEIFAVAQLMHHVGIAVEMNYGSTSGAFVQSSGDPSQPSTENALKTYFRYNSGLFGALRNDFTSAQWDSMLTAELDASRPILYSGNDSDGGHAFVLDGYDSLGLYHVNWGWGGYCDGYYTFDNLSPTGSGIGGNASNAYSSSNWALFHVYPSSEDSIVTVSVVSFDTLTGTVTGGGTFPAYTSTTLHATAREGHRFSHWGSGCHYNPLLFSPNENFIDTAYFVPVYGDTVGYCGDAMLILWGEYVATSHPEWGIRLPVSSFREHSQLNAVQIYGVPDATYTYNVYRGNNRERLVASGIFTSPNFQWNNIPLSRAVPLTGDAPVWITVTSSSYSNPAVASSYSGNPDGSWYKRNGSTWEHLEDRDEYYSWMIRAIAGPLEPVEVTAVAADTASGTVTGSGTYYPGDTAVLTAIPAPGYSFIGWSTGDIANPLYFRVTSAATVIASFRLQTGIEDVTPDGLSTGTATLYDINGRAHATLQTPLSPLPSLATGIYLLRYGNTVKKIVVVQ